MRVKQTINRGLVGSFGCLLVLLLAVAILPHDVQAEEFTINRFHSDITIHEDASVIVTETIEVTFHESRRGIYREIPVRYQTDYGETMRMPIDVAEVTDENGREWTTKISYPGNVINIRIGDADVWINGRQTYVITYEVTNALQYFEGFDELFWNVTGTYWDADILQASATISLSSDQTTSIEQAQCYTGRYGDREQACTVETFENGVKFVATRPLRPYEGLTVAYGFDKGIVAEPSDFQRFMWAINLADNWVLILPFVVLIFMITHWRRKGRDPKVRDAVAVMYEPPRVDGKPLNAAEVGTIIDERVDARDITSGLISLAVGGYLQIEETTKEGLLSLFDSKDYVLTKLKEPDPELSTFETRLMQDVFPAGRTSITVSDMNKKFYKHISGLKKRIYDDLQKKKFFGARPDKVKGRYMLYGVLTMFGTVFLTAPWGLAGFVQAIIAGLVSGFIIIMFSNAMPVKTRAGAQASIEAKGFQEFMMRVEKDRLERMAGKDLFFKYLPYAIALDVADHWAKAFEGIHQEAPSWYISPLGFTHFHAATFTRTLTTATSSMSNAMFSAPRGSGSSGGGGGFSGGGGGGGGGGSW